METELSQYGITFQYKTLACLFLDKSFVIKIIDIIKPEYFESDSNQWIAKLVIDYFKEFENVPTLNVIEVKVKEEPLFKTDAAFKQQVHISLKRVFSYFNDTDLEFVKKEFIIFCKKQAYKVFFSEGIDYISSGQFDKIDTQYKKATKVGMDVDMGLDYKNENEIDQRYLTEVRHTIPTPWECINNITNNGFSAGELITIVAPSGVGKSWLLIAIGADAVKHGKFVLHYTLELNAAYVGKRYDALISGINMTKLEYNHDLLKEQLSKITGDLIIKHYPTKAASINTLRAHIQQATLLKSKKPDLIIVDYADILKGTGSYTDKRYEIGDIYETLRGLADELQVPIYTASQTNRSALDDEIIDGGKVSEDYSKIFTSDFVMTLQRRKEDKMKGTGTLYISKNRFGIDGQWFTGTFDFDNGIIDFNDKKIQDITKPQITSTQDLMAILHNKKQEKINQTTINLG